MKCGPAKQRRIEDNSGSDDSQLIVYGFFSNSYGFKLKLF